MRIVIENAYGQTHRGYGLGQPIKRIQAQQVPLITPPPQSAIHLTPRRNLSAQHFGNDILMRSDVHRTSLTLMPPVLDVSAAEYSRQGNVAEEDTAREQRSSNTCEQAEDRGPIGVQSADEVQGLSGRGHRHGSGQTCFHHGLTAENSPRNTVPREVYHAGRYIDTKDTVSGLRDNLRKNTRTAADIHHQAIFMPGITQQFEQEVRCIKRMR